MRDDDPKTMFKIIATRKTREAWSFFKITLAILLFLAAIGGCQVYHCQSKNPKSTIKKCLMPMRYK